MTFSTRTIQTGTPPASKTVRKLVMTFWLSPIMLPVAIAAASHEFRDARIEKAPNNGAAAASATAHVLPARFKSAQIAMDETGLMSLPDNKVARLDFRLFDQTITTDTIVPLPSKISGRAAHAPEIHRSNIAHATGYNSRPVNMPTYHATNAREPESDNAVITAAGKTHVFRRATAIGPNLIKAGGMTIELASISPPDGHATCKRIDGLVQPCTERAQHRLAILLQARDISCTIKQSGGPATLKAQCKAGNIDLASDLLRNGLAQRSASRKLASVR